MLPKKSNEMISCTAQTAVQEKEWEGNDVSQMGAFPSGASLLFRVRFPRVWGITGVLFSFAADGKEAHSLPMSFEKTACGIDTYCVTPPFSADLEQDGTGLFYYEFIFLCGEKRFFSSTENNLDFTVSEASAEKFRLLFYRPDFHVPSWLGQGVMYHIFVDRFFRGTGDASLHDDGILNPDWDNGIPQYAEKRGGALPNNVFFGGNLWGVIEKLPYLQELGVTTLYLSPLFRARSNHKYDTGDYEQVDSSFGGDAALDALLSETAKRGMHVILDGVFNHTGDDSRYFNRFGTYPTVGAYQSVDSPYHTWYRFHAWPESYESWWGIPILPRLQHENADCRSYFTGENGIGARYMRRGIDGWRLDVADELTDIFLEEFRESVKKASNGKGILLGEVWENAADKVAYGKRRKYLRGGQLDSVMNYPLRAGILAFVCERDAQTLYRVLTEIYASYPRDVSDSLMNLLGTHDTERIFTLLGAEEGDGDRPNRELATDRLRDAQIVRAFARLRVAATVQFTVYGIPSVYYGDEVALEGWHDPFCRMPFPWNQLDSPIRKRTLAFYRKLGRLRTEWDVFDHGEFRVLTCTETAIAYIRQKGTRKVLICANMGTEPMRIPLPRDEVYTDLLQGGRECLLLETQPESVRVIGYDAVWQEEGGGCP